jgi:hypothetical protein
MGEVVLVKKEEALSIDDRLLLNRAKRILQINRIGWGVLLIFLWSTIYLIFSTASANVSEQDLVLVVIIFLMLSILPSWGILYRTRELIKIKDTLRENKKTIIQDVTLSKFDDPNGNNRRYFVNDETSYSFQSIYFTPFQVTLRNLIELPADRMLLLQIASPHQILMKYQEIEEGNHHNPGYTLQVVPLTADDRKNVLNSAITLFRVINVGVLPVTMLVFCFASSWKWALIKNYTLPIWILITATVNTGIMIYFLYLKNQVKSANKEIISGIITEVMERGSGKYYRLTIFVGIESFTITTGETKKDFYIGQPVSLHYVKKGNGDRGVLIKVEKNTIAR